MRNPLFIMLPLICLATVCHSPADGTASPASDFRSDRWEDSLLEDGTVPLWLGAGPFEQSIIGFGEPGDEDVIGEATIVPDEGRREHSTMVLSDSVGWVPLSPGGNGFVDFHEAFSWEEPSAEPEKIWKAHAGYAFTTIRAPAEMEAHLLFGSNGRAKVLLNGEEIHRAWEDRNAVADGDTVSIRLRAGENRLLVKVWQTHRNESIQFFAPIEWQWGFYARVVDEAFGPVQGLVAAVELVEEPLSVEVTPTFFFKESGGALQQEVLVTVTNRSAASHEAQVQLTMNDRSHRFGLGEVRPGRSVHSVFIPQIESPTGMAYALEAGENQAGGTLAVTPAPKYRLHLAMMSHTDIGYTNPQPVVIERHLTTLDEVLDMCDRHPDFRWTVETVWQLDHYERSRPREQFERLMRFVREGRIAVSPVYSNPYTGWISEEEMLRSVDLANEYAERFGITFPAAVYNDVPGFSQFLPRALKEAGPTFLVAGINEVYNNYLLQRTKPKVFRWMGAGGADLVTYRTEAYNEGQTYGMVKGIDAMRYRMWNRLLTYRAQGHDAEVILMNTTLGDNGGIPRVEFERALEWNERYAYPKIHMSTINDFAEAFLARHDDNLPGLRGDWTSTWDILYQGEPGRMIRQRWAQHHLLAAEKLGSISWMVEAGQEPLAELIGDAYRSLLTFSGHGSGLEYGYGSPEENLVTMGFREQYVRDAVFKTEEALQRGIYRLAMDEFAFDREGVLVFNPHSWTVDGPVVADFPVERGQRFSVTDLETGETVPSFQDGHRLRFVARGLPPVGFRKFGIDPIGEPASGVGGHMAATSSSIENDFYRIEIDPSSGGITRITDVRDSRELTDGRTPMPFGMPVSTGVGDVGDLRPVSLAALRTAVIDERPVRLSLRLDYDHPVFIGARIDLWEGTDQIDMTWDVKLEGLTPPEAVEEYGIAFPFSISEAQAHVEVSGGFMPGRHGRFASIDHDAYSIRRSVALAGSDRAIHFASVDGRVLRLRESDGEAAPVVIANVVNNFPESWNRYEENRGTISYRFSFRSAEQGYDPSGAARFGWSAALPPIARRTWFAVEPAGKSFFAANGDAVNLRSVRAFPEQDALLLTLVNENPAASTTAVVESPFFRNVHAFRSNTRLERTAALPVSNGVLTINLAPGETLFVAVFPDGSNEMTGR